MLTPAALQAVLRRIYAAGAGAASAEPDTVRQEIYGYLLTHYAISALICRAATEADIDPDEVKFLRTVRSVRRRRRHPLVSPRDQTRPTQPLPGQTTPSHRHPPCRGANHQPGQPETPPRKINLV
jgi:hypothetical protein